MRIWIFDFLRGISIISMVIYHIFFDYYFLKGELFPYYYLAPFIGGSFIAISGIVMKISLRRAKNPYKKAFVRFLRLGLLALLISLATYIFYPNCFVKFGIIHFFAVSAILLPIFIKTRIYGSFFGFVLFISGLYIMLNGIYAESRYLFWLGIPYPDFCSLDYYPLLPWFGLYLIFFSVADYIVSKFEDKNPKISRLNPIAFIGKHSLTIYVIHQPIIVLILLAFLNR